MYAKVNQLQQSYRDLTFRERSLSQAKLEMAKERIELQSLHNKLSQTRCSLCKIGERSQELADILTKGMNDNPYCSTAADGVNAATNEINYKSSFDIDMPNLDTDSKSFENYLDFEVRTELQKMKEETARNLEMNLDSIPNLTNTSNNLLDHELLMVKLDAMRAYNYL